MYFAAGGCLLGCQYSQLGCPTPAPDHGRVLTADIGQPVASYFLEGGVESYEDEYYLVNQPEYSSSLCRRESGPEPGRGGYTTNFGGSC